MCLARFALQWLSKKKNLLFYLIFLHVVCRFSSFLITNLVVIIAYFGLLQ